MKHNLNTRNPENLTRILSELRMGRTGARAELVTVVYDELRRLAASQIGGTSPILTLATCPQSWSGLYYTEAFREVSCG